MGLADLELYLGRYKEAETLLGTGIAEDQTSGNASSLAIKRVALAEAYQGSGRNPSALPILAEVSRQSREPAVVVPVARMLARAGHLEEADKLAGELDGRLQPQLRAYAKIIDGVVALRKGRRASAIDGFRDSVKLTDFWLARYEYGDHLCAGRYVRGGAHRARGVRETARRSDGTVSRRHSDGAIPGNASVPAGPRARRPQTVRGGANPNTRNSSSFAGNHRPIRCCSTRANARDSRRKPRAGRFPVLPAVCAFRPASLRARYLIRIRNGPRTLTRLHALDIQVVACRPGWRIPVELPGERALRRMRVGVREGPEERVSRRCLVDNGWNVGSSVADADSQVNPAFAAVERILGLESPLSTGTLPERPFPHDWR